MLQNLGSKVSRGGSLLDISFRFCDRHFGERERERERETETETETETRTDGQTDRQTEIYRVTTTIY